MLCNFGQLYFRGAHVQNALAVAEVSMVASVLRWVYLLERFQPKVTGSVSVTLRVSRIMCTYLTGKSKKKITWKRHSYKHTSGPVILRHFKPCLFSLKIIFSSSELKTQASFFWSRFVCCYSCLHYCCHELFTVWTSPSELLGQIQPNLTQSILGLWTSNGYSLFKLR